MASFLPIILKWNEWPHALELEIIVLAETFTEVVGILGEIGLEDVVDGGFFEFVGFAFAGGGVVEGDVDGGGLRGSEFRVGIWCWGRGGEEGGEEEEESCGVHFCAYMSSGKVGCLWMRVDVGLNSVLVGRCVCAWLIYRVCAAWEENRAWSGDTYTLPWRETQRPLLGLCY